MQNELENFVSDILSAVPKPLTEHVTCHVFWLIERRPEWGQRYEHFITRSPGGAHTVNQNIGKAVKAVLDAENLGETDAPEDCALIKTYTRLHMLPNG